MDKNKFDELLKTEDGPLGVLESDATSKILLSSKRKIKHICKNLCLDADKYAPEKSMRSIDEFLKSKGKLERILYSEISNYIFGLTEGERGTFASNVEELLLYAMNDGNKYDADSVKIVIKIYDHFHLALHQIENVQSILANSVADTKEAIQDDVKGMQKEYITILGIFASVILAFVGGITFSSSVLQNIDAVSIYRLLIVVDLIAMALINAIYVLVHFIMQINNKGESLFKIKHLNIAMLLFAALVIVSWFLDVGALADYIGDFLPWTNQ